MQLPSLQPQQPPDSQMMFNERAGQHEMMRHLLPLAYWAALCCSCMAQGWSAWAAWRGTRGSSKPAVKAARCCRRLPILCRHLPRSCAVLKHLVLWNRLS